MTKISIFKFLLLLILSCSNLVNASTNDSNVIFNWAEYKYAELFQPKGAETKDIQGYTARYYKDTKTYLGTKDGQVYAYGDAFGGLLKAGSVEDILSQVHSEPELPDLNKPLTSDTSSDMQLKTIFDWAEYRYAALFQPKGAETTDIQGYTARYYKNTKTYLGVKEGKVYAYGDAFGGLLKAGSVAEILSQVNLELELPDLNKPLIAGITAEIQLQAKYVNNSKLRFSLIDYPEGVELNSLSGLITWKPSDSDVGKEVSFKAQVTDGTFIAKQQFKASVVKSTPVAMTMENNTSTVTEGLLTGFSIESQLPEQVKQRKLSNKNNLSIEKLLSESVPDLPEQVEVVSEFFIIKNDLVADEYIIELPLHKVLDNINLHRVKLYNYDTHSSEIGSKFWNSVGFDKELDWNPISRSVRLKLADLKGIFVLVIEPEEEIDSRAKRSKSEFKHLDSSIPKSSVICTPKFVEGRFVDSLDYDDQTCTVSSDLYVKIRVLEFGKGTRSGWGNVDIHDLIIWLIDAQKAFEDLDLQYDKKITIQLEKNNGNKKGGGFVSGSGSENSETIHMTKSFSGGRELIVRDLLVHEYFHNAQARTQGSKGNAESRDVLWFVEGSARWFEDFVYDGDNSYLIWEKHKLTRFLEAGLKAMPPEKNYLISIHPFRAYQRFSFWKLLYNKCDEFSEGNDFTLANFLTKSKPMFMEGAVKREVLQTTACDFGGFLGSNKRHKLETAILWYQYATLARKDFSLIEDDEIVTNDKKGLKIEESSHKFLLEEGFSSDSNSAIQSYPALSAQSFFIRTNGSMFTVPEGKELVLNILSSDKQLIVSIIHLAGDSISDTACSVNNNGGIDGYQHRWYETGNKTQNQCYFAEGSGIDELFVTIINPTDDLVELTGPVKLELRDKTNTVNTTGEIFPPLSNIFINSFNISHNVSKQRSPKGRLSTSKTTKYKGYSSFNKLMSSVGFKISDNLYQELSGGILKINNLSINITGNSLINNGVMQSFDLGSTLKETLTASNMSIDSFEFDENKNLYILPFAKLFPQLNFSKYDNSLINLDIKVDIEYRGEIKNGSLQVAYATVIDVPPEISSFFGKISGKIQNNNGSPLNGASVSLEPSGRTLYTDSNGEFTFDNSQSGLYTLKISKDGFSDADLSFALSGEVFDLDGHGYNVLGSENSVSINLLLDKEELNPYQEHVTDGVVKSYYESGALLLETPYKSGVIDGILKSYYENGVLSSETPYKNGDIDGVEKKHYESGALLSETPLKLLVSEIDFKSYGIDGILKKYYESGILSSETPYKNDDKDGISKSYFASGALLSETVYKSDVRDGIEKYYYESGVLSSETPYKNDLQDGISLSYYESGRISSETPYSNGSFHGISTLYNQDGVLLIEWPYINGKLQGIMKEYYETGSLKGEIPYHSDTHLGNAILYGKNGEILCANAFYNELGIYECTVSDKVGVISGPSVIFSYGGQPLTNYELSIPANENRDFKLFVHPSKEIVSWKVSESIPFVSASQDYFGIGHTELSELEILIYPLSNVGVEYLTVSGVMKDGSHFEVRLRVNLI